MIENRFWKYKWYRLFIDWHRICRNNKLGESFIEKYADDIC